MDILKKIDDDKRSLPYAKPLVKWVGGKRQLLQELISRLPDDFNDYYEPFVGGGALYFYIKQNTTKKCHISDLNRELIEMFETVRDNPLKLIEKLTTHSIAHKKDYYYNVRAKYNLTDKIDRSARMLYLNKTCFNGLYRVNKKGQFNVPIGKYKNPDIIQADNIKAVSTLLQDTTIKILEFNKIKPMKYDFVYFDPPYYPLNATSNFTSYTQNKFETKMQYKLKEFMDKLNKRGVFFMTSNSNTEFIRELYKNYNIDFINANRRINSKATKRGIVKELIARNY